MIKMENTGVFPIFPLPIVQFPGALTPLHIFEPRYRKMLEDILSGDKSFGILLRGEEEVTTPASFSEGNVGCLVEVAVVQQLPDGRSNILCVGGSRFRLVRFVDGEEPYDQAEVELFDDDVTFEDLSTEAELTRALFARLLRANRQLKGDREQIPEELPEIPDDPQALSFVVASYLELNFNQKQRWLELTDTRQRLREINQLLEPLVDDQEKQARVSRIAKTNGHAGKVPRFD